MNKKMAAYIERHTAEVQAFILLTGTGGLRAVTHRGYLEKGIVAKYSLLINCYLIY